MYNYVDDSNKRQAVEVTAQATPQRDAYSAFRYHPQHQHGFPDREMHTLPEGGPYQPRPSSSSYTASRPETAPQGYPNTIDARARYRDQQYYPPRTAGPSVDRHTRPPGLALYPPTGPHPISQRPTTAPAMHSPHMIVTPDAYSRSPSRQQHLYRLPQTAVASTGRPSSSTAEHMPPPRGFGPPIAGRYQQAEMPEQYPSYIDSGGRSPQHHYTHAPGDGYLPRIQSTTDRQRPSSSSGGPRITLPSLSEMIRRPDLDLPSIPASTSSLRTLLNPEARTGTAADSVPQAERPYRAAASHGHSPAPSEEPENPSEEDRRYYVIRARQMQHRRPSMTER